MHTLITFLFLNRILEWYTVYRKNINKTLYIYWTLKRTIGGWCFVVFNLLNCFMFFLQDVFTIISGKTNGRGKRFYNRELPLTNLEDVDDVSFLLEMVVATVSFFCCSSFDVSKYIVNYKYITPLSKEEEHQRTPQLRPPQDLFHRSIYR